MTRLHALEVADARVELDLDAGGRARSWRVGSGDAALDLIGGRGPGAVEYGMYVMAPWPGRLRGNRVVHDGVAHPLPVTHEGWALHGTVLDAAVDVVEADERDGRAYVETLAPLGLDWPWPGRVRQVWELRPGVLHTLVAVETDGPTFPAEAGWHPWFHRRLGRGEDVVVDLAASGMLERGPDHLPTGRVLDTPPPGPYDDAFVVPSGRGVLTWPGALRLEVDSDVGWYVVFDELPDWVCVEPQTAPPDGLGEATALGRPGAVTTPEHRRQATAAWRWTLLS